MASKKQKFVFASPEDALRARQLKREYRRRRVSEITMAVWSSVYALQSTAQTVKDYLPSSGVTVTGNGAGGGYGLINNVGTVNLGGSTKAVIQWGNGLGIAGNQTLSYTNGASLLNPSAAQALVLNKVMGNQESVFNGQIKVDSSIGNLIFVNPNGFTIGGNFSVGTLAAFNTGLLLSTRDFADTANLTTVANGSNTFVQNNATLSDRNIVLSGDPYMGLGAPTGSSTGNIAFSSSTQAFSSGAQNTISLITDSGHVTVVGNVSVPAVLAAGTVYITTNTGNITATEPTGRISAEQGLYINSSNGTVDATMNNIAPIFVSTSGNVTLGQIGLTKMTLGNISAGNLAITSDQNIQRQVGTSLNVSGGAIDVQVAQNKTIGEANNALSLSAANLSVGGAGGATPGSVYIDFNGNLTLGDVKSGGAAVSIKSASAADVLTQAGNLTLTAANQTLSFGSATVNNLNLNRANIGALTISGRDIQVAGVTNTNAAIVIDATGNISSTNPSATVITANGLELKGGVGTSNNIGTQVSTLTASNVSAITLTNAGNLAVNGAFAGTGDVNLTAGNLSLGAASRAGNVALSATNIVQTGALSIGGTTTLSGTTANLSNASNTFAGNVSSNLTGALSLSANGGLTLGNTTATSVTLATINDGSVSATGSNAIGSLTAQLGNGALTFTNNQGNLALGNIAVGSAALQTSGNFTTAAADTVSAATGNITLTSSGLNLSGNMSAADTVRVASNDTTASITFSELNNLNLSKLQTNANGTLAIGAVNQTGNVTVDTSTTTQASLILSGGNIAITEALSTGSKNLTLNANTEGGRIAQSNNGALTTNNLTVTTANGAVTLDKTSNAISGNFSAAMGTGNLALTNSRDLSLGDVTAGNANISIVADGNLSQVSGASLNLGNGLALSTTNGAVWLDQNSNIAGTITANVNGALTLSNSNAETTLGEVAANGSINITGQGNLTTTANVTAADGNYLSLTARNGNLTTAEGKLITSGENGYVSIVAGDALTLNGQVTGNKLNLGAGAGGVQANGAVLTATNNDTSGGLSVGSSGDAMLANANNSIAGVVEISADGNVNLSNSRDLKIGYIAGQNNSAATNLTLNVNGTVEQNNGVRVSGLTEINANSANLSYANNKMNTLTANVGSGALIVSNNGSLSLGSITAGNTSLTLSQGDLTQSSANLSVGALQVQTAGGNATLTQSDNNITGAVSANIGAGTLAITNTGNLTLGNVTAGSAGFDVRGDGALSQSADTALTVTNGLDVRTANGAASFNQANNITGTVTANVAGNLSLINLAATTLGNVAATRVFVDSTGVLNVNGAVTASQDIISLTARNGLSSNANGEITAANSSVNFEVNGNLSLGANVSASGGAPLGGGLIVVSTLDGNKSIGLGSTSGTEDLRVSSESFGKLKTSSVLIGSENGTVNVVGDIAVDARLALLASNISVNAALNTGDKSLRLISGFMNGNVGGSITSNANGVITAGTLGVATNDGNVSLTAQNNISGVVTANIGNGSLTLVNTGNTTLGNGPIVPFVALGGVNVTVTGEGKTLTQNSAITVGNALTVSTANGAVTLNDANNSITGSVAANIGSAALTITNNGTLTLGNTTAGNVTLDTSLANAAIAANGTNSITGVISANAGTNTVTLRNSVDMTLGNTTASGLTLFTDNNANVATAPDAVTTVGGITAQLGNGALSFTNNQGNLVMGNISVGSADLKTTGNLSSVAGDTVIANVSNVTLTSSGLDIQGNISAVNTVRVGTFDQNATISLGGVPSSADLVVSNVSLANLQTNTNGNLAIGGVNQQGNLTVDGVVSPTANMILSGGNIAINETLNTNGKNLTLNANANQGVIVQAGNGTLTTADLTVSTVNGAVTLNDANNAISGNFSAALGSGDLTLSNSQTTYLGNITANNANISVTSENRGISLGNANSLNLSGNLAVNTLNATIDLVNDDGSNNITGTVTAAAGSGAFQLNTAGNTTLGDVTANGGINVASWSGINVVGNISTTSSFNLDSATFLSVQDGKTLQAGSGTSYLTAGEGNIDANGATIIAPTLQIRAPGGDVNLGNTNNNISILQTWSSVGGNLTLGNSGDLAIDGVHVDGSTNLTVLGGNVTTISTASLGGVINANVASGSFQLQNSNDTKLGNITAVNANITVANPGNITQAADSQLSVGDLTLGTSNGSAELIRTNNQITGTVTANVAGALSITNNGALTLGNTNAGDVTLNTSLANGEIVANGTNVISGAFSANAGTGNLTLANTQDTQLSSITANAANITLSAGNLTQVSGNLAVVDLNVVTAGGNANLSYGTNNQISGVVTANVGAGNLDLANNRDTQLGDITAANANFTVTGGNIDNSSGALNIAGNLGVTALDGAAYLDYSSNNNVGGVVAANVRNGFVFSNSRDTQLGNIASSFTYLNVGGNITQADASSSVATGSLYIGPNLVGVTDVTLGNANNTIGSINAAMSGNLTLRNATDLRVNQLGVGGNATLTVAGNITSGGGDVSVSNLDVNTSNGGRVELTNSNSISGVITGNVASSLNVTNNGNTTLGNITAASAGFDVRGDGTLTQSANTALTLANGLDVNTANGAVTLGNANNIDGVFSANVAGDLLVNNTRNLSLGNLIANNANIALSNGALTQVSGNLTVGALDIQTNNANANLSYGSSNQISGNLSARLGTGDLTVTNNGALTLGNTTAGAVTLDTSLANGAIVANGTNVITGVVSANAGTGNVTLANTQDTQLGSITGNATSITLSAGNLSQVSGNIAVGAFDIQTNNANANLSYGSNNQISGNLTARLGTGDLTVTNNNALTLSDSTAGNVSLDTSAANGSITASGNNSFSGLFSANAGAGNLVLANSQNTLLGNITANDANISGTSEGKRIASVSGNSLSLSGNLSVNTLNARILLATDNAINGTVTATTGNGSFQLNNVRNTTLGDITAGGDVYVTSQTGLNVVGNISTLKTFDLEAGSDLTVLAGKTLQAGSGTSYLTAGGNINANSATIIAPILSVGSGGDANLGNINNNISTLQTYGGVSGNLTLATNAGLTIDGGVDVGGATTLTTSGSVVTTGSGTYLRGVINADLGSGNLELKNSVNTTLGNINTTGDANITLASLGDALTQAIGTKLSLNNLTIKTNGGLGALTESSNQITGTVAANVGSAALSITNNGALTLGNTTAGAVTLDTSMANGAIVANGTNVITGVVSANAGTGNVALANTRALSLGDLIASNANITLLNGALTQVSGNIAVGALDITTNNANANLSYGSNNQITGNLTARLGTGDLTVTNNSALTLGDTTARNVTLDTSSAGGTITANGSNSFQGVISANAGAGDLTLSNDQYTKLGNITANNANLSVTANGSAVNLESGSKLTLTGNLSVNTVNAQIDLLATEEGTAFNSINGTVTATAGSGRFYLNSSGNLTLGDVNAGGISAHTSTGKLDVVGNLTATSDFSLSANTGLTIGSGTTVQSGSGTSYLRTQNGDIEANTANISASTLSVVAATGNISANAATISASTLQVTAQGDAAFGNTNNTISRFETNTGDAGNYVGGNLTLGSTGNLVIAGAQVDGSTNLTIVGGDVTTTRTAFLNGVINANVATGNFQLQNAYDTKLGNITTQNANITVVSDGNITQVSGSQLSLGNLTLGTSNGSALLTQANQITGTVTANVGVSALSITNNGSLTLGNTTAGAVTLDTSLANGAIVANGTNVISGEFAANAGTGNLTLANTQDTQLGSITANAASITLSAGNLSQVSGNLSVGDLNVVTAGGNANITYGSDNQIAGVITATIGSGNLDLTNNRDTKLGSITANATSFTLGAGDLTQFSGNLSVGDLTVNTAGGNVTLTSGTNNNIGGVFTANVGAGNVSLSNEGSLQLGNITSGNTSLFPVGITEQTVGSTIATGTLLIGGMSGTDVTLNNADNRIGTINVDLSGNLSLKNATDLKVDQINLGSGNATLTVAGNITTGSGIVSANNLNVTATNGNVTLSNDNLVNELTANVSNGLTFNNNQSLNLGNITAASANFNVSGGSLVQTAGNLTIAGDLDVISSSSANLSYGTNNRINGTITANVGDTFNLLNNQNTSIGNITAVNNVVLYANGNNITQQTNTAVAADYVQLYGNNVTLDGYNSINTIYSSANNLTLNNTKDLNLDGVYVNNATLTVAGNISQTSWVDIGNLNVTTTSGGNVDLSNFNNNIGNLTANVANDLTVASYANLKLADITTAGNASFSANTLVQLSGNLTIAGNLGVYTNGYADLSTSNNNTIAGFINGDVGGEFNLKTASDATLGNLNANSLYLTVDGNITNPSGVLSTGYLDVQATGNVSIGNANSALVGEVRANVGGNFALANNGSSIYIDGITAANGGVVSVTTSGQDVVIGGTITGTGGSYLSSIALGTGGNDLRSFPQHGEIVNDWSGSVLRAEKFTLAGTKVGVTGDVPVNVDWRESTASRINSLTINLGDVSLVTGNTSLVAVDSVDGRAFIGGATIPKDDGVTGFVRIRGYGYDVFADGQTIFSGSPVGIRGTLNDLSPYMDPVGLLGKRVTVIEKELGTGFDANNTVSMYISRLVAGNVGLNGFGPYEGTLISSNITPASFFNSENQVNGVIGLTNRLNSFSSLAGSPTEETVNTVGSSLVSNLNVTGTLTAASASITGTLNAGATTLASANVTGNLVAGNISTAGTLDVTGVSTLGNVSAGNLTVTGATTTAGLTNTGDLTNNGNASITGTLNAGATTLASANVTGNLVAGNISTAGTLDVTGVSTLGNVSAGNLTVTGATTTAGLTNTGDLTNNGNAQF
ncbi:S-layer family protein, partial [Limnohabitans sp. Jir72]|uniref:S-layer family protein n=1 Tax=Limnohabitans sp. Jir72 TaxID=1977909 RepID=UPI000DD24770